MYKDIKTIKFLYRKLQKLLRIVILQINKLYLIYFPSDWISDHIKDVELNLRRSKDQSARLQLLLSKKKLIYLDVGARGGLNKLLNCYRNYISAVMVEPDEKAFENLVKQGLQVVDKAIAGSSGSSAFYILKKGGLSSLLLPNGKFLSYYAGDSDRFDIIKTEQKPTITIEELSEKLNLNIDILKLDTEGSELDILKGLGKDRPLIIICEMSFVELYIGQSTIFELGSYLRSLGYLACEINYQNTPPPIKIKNSRNMFMNGLPVHGDIVFIPDWTTVEGQAILRADELKWASIMLIYGLEDVLYYLITKLELKHKDLIRKALSISIKNIPEINVLDRVSY